MNKKEYLSMLDSALKGAGVQDRDDIIGEYAEHFDMKAADGYGEDEIAARLAAPNVIASQFGEIAATGGIKPVNKAQALKKALKVLSITGLLFADILVGAFFITMYAWVVSLGAFSLSSALAGGLMVTGIGAESSIIHLPAMPYLCAFLLGIAMLALAVLSACGTEYCRLYVTQMLKVYARWHGSIAGIKNASPPLPAHPVIKPKKRRIMRKVTLVALVVFVVAFIASLSSMMIKAGSLEPWHVWGWFA